jgi:CreA protein
MNKLLMAALALILAGPVWAEEVGSVTTAFKLIGRNHRVQVDAYDDPKVEGVTCYMSRAKTGGVKGSLGLAEDKAEFSIACRQIGKLIFKKPLPQQEEVFSESASLFFKSVQVVRMVDVKRNALVYLTYSDKLIDGSPQNSVTAVSAGDVKIPMK